MQGMHCTSISWLFLAYSAIMQDGGFVNAWNGTFNLQNFLFAWRHVESCYSVITTACVSSYVIPIYLLLILYWAGMSPCGTGRLKISYIWCCCALSYIGTYLRSKKIHLLLACVSWDTGRIGVCHLMIYLDALLKVVVIQCVWAYFWVLLQDIYLVIVYWL